MKKILLVAVTLCVVSACTNKAQELKSPCVGVDDSPCGPKRPANAWLYT